MKVNRKGEKLQFNIVKGNNNSGLNIFMKDGSGKSIKLDHLATIDPKKKTITRVKSK